MATYTIKIDEHHQSAEAFMAMIKALPFIEFMESKPEPSKSQKEIYYNPDFVRKIKKAEKRGEYTEIDIKDIWGSLSLKQKD